ncbi:hypothetical protein [Sedimentitalea todarodis]|uniref:Uncharacterized protein n=1 Tax=Sedimentitalea todarodis TaxID=1631240 RepID=A0ABU3VI96_9RHOB|nr:hypothetical protein [Sedimentitalea todarodis]MDU9005414.1 hypothetical protein [Sedimentitalea todarodis]
MKDRIGSPQAKPTWLARAGGAAANTGMSVSLAGGGIPAAFVPQRRSAKPKPPGTIKSSGSKIRSPSDRHPNGQIGATRGGHETKDGARIREMRPGRLDQRARGVTFWAQTSLLDEA